MSGKEQWTIHFPVSAAVSGVLVRSGSRSPRADDRFVFVMASEPFDTKGPHRLPERWKGKRPVVTTAYSQ
jgi:hypothetical protein